MKKNDELTIVAVLAIILIALYYNVYVLFALVIFFPILIWRISKKKDAIVLPIALPLTIEEAFSKYGEPDKNIIVDATRANEVAGCILVYKNQRIMIIGGEPIGMNGIKDVTSVNTATPYTVGQYQVVLTTKIPKHRYIRINAGMDAEWARNVAMEIIDCVKQII